MEQQVEGPFRISKHKSVQNFSINKRSIFEEYLKQRPHLSRQGANLEENLRDDLDSAWRRRQLEHLANEGQKIFSIGVCGKMLFEHQRMIVKPNLLVPVDSIISPSQFLLRQQFLHHRSVVLHLIDLDISLLVLLIN